MFFIDIFNKTNHFKIREQYSIIYQYIYGNFGRMNISSIGQKISTSRNFRGRPLSFFIDKDDIISKNVAIGEFFYFYQLIYNDNNKRRVEEIKLGEPKSVMINYAQFPMYFYLKLNEGKKDVDILVNLRLKTNNDFELYNKIEIRGYLLNQNDIMKMINDEYITLIEPFEGYYSNSYDIGFIQIKNNIMKVINIF